MSDQIIAQTQSGAVEGRTKDGAQLFAGIPYATPPVGELRFKAAREHPDWDGVRSAKKFGPAAPQVPSGGMTDSAAVRWDEDCLTLNVTTPAADDQKRPVLVWIHGGAYRTGQGSIPWYNGARFATNGNIVTVSINYRLGALGFTDLSSFGSDYATSGCNGILDQITALRWVQNNIAAFGGDPEQVTIAGESAGGFSVSTLLGSPVAQGLFHRAIPQSGGAHSTLTADQGAQVTAAFLEALGTDNLVGLHGASVDSILAAQATADRALAGPPALAGALGTTVSPFYPVVGSEVLPQSPLDAIRGGLGSDVAVLTGSNRDETTLWGYGRVDEDKLNATADGLADSRLLGEYRATRPDADSEALMIAITTDHMFRIPAIRLAEARAAFDAQTWLYQFDWRSAANDGKLGATHALEIPFAFDNLHQAGVDAFVGPVASPQHVADVMHRAWIDFIATGNPGWPAYVPASRTTMCFNDSSAPVDDPHSRERLAWEGLR